MNVVDDARLLELAREPIRELLPTACRVSAMKPLVVLLAFLPGLLVFRYATLDEATSLAGLQALKLSAATAPLEWLAASGDESSVDSPVLAPLVGVLVGLSLKSELLTPESRLLLVSYVSSVCMLLILFSLTSKVGGSRFAFAAVLLMCCHRGYFEMSSCLPPISLALSFAFLGFRGILSHQDDDDRLATWPLIGAAFALLACWLVSGPIAIVSWLFICVQSLTVSGFDCKQRSTSAQWSRTVRRRLERISYALISILVMTALTLTLLCLWNVFTLGLRPAAIWQLVVRQSGVDSGTFSLPWFTLSRGAVATGTFLELSGALLGFVLLGLFNSARGLVLRRSESTCRRDRFVMGWFVVAWLTWFVSWPRHHGEFLTSEPWSTLILIPIVLLAAQGLEEILGRRFGLGAVLVGTLVTLGVNLAPHISTRWNAFAAPEGLVTMLMGLLLTLVSSMWLFHRLCCDDRRRRVAILLCVLAGVATNVAAGLYSLRPQTDDERELIAFRRQLSVEAIPSECWLISDEVPPARIRFFLQSLWPQRAIRWSSDWDTMFAGVAERSPAGDQATVLEQPVSGARSRVVVTWGTQKWPAADLRQRGQTLVQSTDSHFFRRRLLRAYRWSERTESK